MFPHEGSPAKEKFHLCLTGRGIEKTKKGSRYLGLKEVHCPTLQQMFLISDKSIPCQVQV